MYTKEQQLLCDIRLDNGKQEGPKKEFKNTLIEEIHTDTHSTGRRLEKATGREEACSRGPGQGGQDPTAVSSYLPAEC